MIIRSSRRSGRKIAEPLLAEPFDDGKALFRRGARDVFPVEPVTFFEPRADGTVAGLYFFDIRTGGVLQRELDDLTRAAGGSV